MPDERLITYAQALHEALAFKLETDPSVYLLGEGVSDPKGIFGTTLGFVERFGHDRVIDMPVAENGLTGIAIGSALNGQRPVMTHQRVDFLLLAMDQLANNAAKLRYVFCGKFKVPLVVRAIVGRGWGQSAQHAQSLEVLFSHFPGLKVVMPTTAHDAKGMLIAAIEDDNPVIFLEHRWLHHALGEVPLRPYRVPLDGPRIARSGDALTIVATSLMVVEALQAATALAAIGIQVEVIDLRVLRPLSLGLIADSVSRTGRLLTIDTGWSKFGIGAEIVASITEQCFGKLRAAPRRLGLADHPAPSALGLIENYYPDAWSIADTICEMLQLPELQRSRVRVALGPRNSGLPLDVPNESFKGPF
jgi:acetoin:2,6-dichlorophenolindophenol oxidoreductase subunit beta